VVAEAVPTRRRDEDGKLLYEFELGKKLCSLVGKANRSKITSRFTLGFQNTVL